MTLDFTAEENETKELSRDAILLKIAKLLEQIEINTRIKSSEIPYSKRKLNAPTIAPDKDRRINAILFTCKPGKRPVAIPVITPKTQKRITRRRGSITITLLKFDIFCGNLHRP